MLGNTYKYRIHVLNFIIKYPEILENLGIWNYLFSRLKGSIIQAPDPCICSSSLHCIFGGNSE